jgi:PTS system N-acetylglucosamine-specific IIC component
MKKLLPQLQRVGGALMLPIAVLPVAALLLRLGQPDLLGIKVMAEAGQAIFANLGLLFAVGVAIGLARENHGAAGVAAVVSYLIITQGAAALIVLPPAALAGVPAHARALVTEAYRRNELLELTVPIGMISGLIGGALYNRYHALELPSYLAFFGGRRFVPIASGCVALPVALLVGSQWHHLESAMEAMSRGVLAAGPWGLFAYGVLNRLLIVTGLHHIINSIAWFMLGDYRGVTGDLNRFFAGDPTAGSFMAGFFPVMMFGLPAACLAMYHTARPERRAAVAGLLLSIALTSFLTGVTEPVEFSFMFLAPALYAVHALLTGLSFIIMNALGVRLGFGFSAGLFDYVLNFAHATRPLLLLPVGALYFALYYGIFRFAIVRFDLQTPGRESEPPAPARAERALGSGARSRDGEPRSMRGEDFVAALGGAANLEAVSACTTRLRLTVRAQEAVDPQALKRLGALGVVRPSANALQVVLGPIADRIAGEIRHALAEATPADSPRSPATIEPNPAAVPAMGAPAAREVPPPFPQAQLPGLLAALGGRANVRAVAEADTRLRIAVADTSRVDEAAIRALGLRGVAIAAVDCVHIIVGPGASSACSALSELLAP